jgi:hypothetical protein
VFCWRFKGIKKFTGKTREVLIVYKIHHPKTYIGRQYVKKRVRRRRRWWRRLVTYRSDT